MDKFWMSTRAQVFYYQSATGRQVSQTLADVKENVTSQTVRDLTAVLSRLAPETHRMSHVSLIHREQLELG